MKNNFLNLNVMIRLFIIQVLCCSSLFAYDPNDRCSSSDSYDDIAVCGQGAIYPCSGSDELSPREDEDDEGDVQTWKSFKSIGAALKAYRDTKEATYQGKDTECESVPLCLRMWFCIEQLHQKITPELATRILKFLCDVDHVAEVITDDEYKFLLFCSYKVKVATHRYYTHLAFNHIAVHCCEVCIGHVESNWLG